MEKLLAMSILSSGPDVPGIGGLKEKGWFGRGWTKRKNNEGDKEKKGEKESNRSAPKQQLPRLAVELDGLYCFETIVSS